MTDRIDVKDERRPQVLPVASVGQGVEHLLTDRVLTAGFTRGAWYEVAPVVDLRFPLATVEPEQCGDRRRRRQPTERPMRTESPDLVIAMRLLDHAKLRGFEFRRDAPGEDGPLVGHRVNGNWADTIHIDGFSRDCLAWRKRTSSLIVPGNGLVERRVDGSALDVLNEVLTWETGS